MAKGPSDAQIFAAVWEDSVVGFGVLDLSGRWLRANSALCRFLEYSESELQDRSYQNLTHSDDLDHDVQMATRVAAGEISGYYMGKRYVTKRGRVVEADLWVSAIYDSAGKPVAFFSQVSPVLTAVGAREPAVERKSTLLTVVKDYSKVIAIVIALAAAFVAEIWDKLKHLGVGGK